MYEAGNDNDWENKFLGCCTMELDHHLAINVGDVSLLSFITDDFVKSTLSKLAMEVCISWPN